MGWLAFLFLLPGALLVMALGQVISSRSQGLSDEPSHDLTPSLAGGRHLGFNGLGGAVFNIDPDANFQSISRLQRWAPALRGLAFVRVFTRRHLDELRIAWQPIYKGLVHSFALIVCTVKSL